MPAIGFEFLHGRQRVADARKRAFCANAPLAALRLVIAIASGLLWLSPALAQAAEAPPLQLEAKITLGDVRGRIDHMAFDAKRQRLFVAELGNDTVGVVDLAARKVIRTLKGLKEPQGIGYEPTSDMLYVANAKDGSVHLFQGADYEPAGQIALGDDADNIRIDAAGKQVLVGYGSGGLAVLDPSTRAKIADIPLAAHPESFQLDPETNRILVNVPAARSVVVIDRQTGKEVMTWPAAGRGGNFPMALDLASRRALIVFRSPAALGVFSMANGATVANVAVCGDSDDVFVDARRQRAYVSCGEGFIDIFDTNGATYERIGHVPTASGARTSLFVPELDRFLLAVPARAQAPAAIWVFGPATP